MTQHKKIIELCGDRRWHCQTEFWAISKSPHKRRGEIEKKWGVKFKARPCEHGIKGSNDYFMVLPDLDAYLKQPVTQSFLDSKLKGEKETTNTKLDI